MSGENKMFYVAEELKLRLLMEEEEEEPWDADLLEEERITNPPSRTLFREHDREPVEVSADVFDYGTLPESTPEPGEPGFHWGM